MDKKVNVFWFRRDLRLNDNVGLQKALLSDLPVLPIFIFDNDILDKLEDRYDRRVDYFHQALNAMNEELHLHNFSIHFYKGTSQNSFKTLLNEFKVNAVYCNSDYEPQAIERDKLIKEYLSANGVEFYNFKDQVIFEKSEIVKSDNTPYTIFTPYSKKWKSELTAENYLPSDFKFDNFYKSSPQQIPTLKSLKFEKTYIVFKQPELNAETINNYDKFRNFPAMDNTTHLGIALRFGTISIRECVSFALNHNEVWLSELIWREFFMQILFHFPRVVYNSFKLKYDNIEWRNNEDEFKLWCEGKTGYPIVDAGMRQLNKTGFMHNRVRMIVASFLCKHLLIDWRWGEAYFAEKLLDYDLSSNNGNWQWAAGSGCDSAPYFRIFNPTTQTLKFDKDLKYIKKWNPDFDKNLDLPIVEHAFARERALRIYKKAVQEF